MKTIKGDLILKKDKIIKGEKTMKTLKDKRIELIRMWDNGEISIEGVFDEILKQDKQAIKEMQDWINHIVKTTLITGETFIEVMLDKFGDIDKQGK